MNPLSKAIRDMKLAPMREVSKTLQIRWYRCPVDKKTLRSLMTPDDTRGLFMALGHLGLWAATGGITFYLFWQQMWLGFVAALFVHGTVGSF
ncbi:MAG: fatty acid desaturase, partial [Pseudomonadota bacterium]|nr:fatty acid desaturase [Pseudomonadota bacterium]